MHLLYDLPAELQQVILTQGMQLHLHRLPTHRMLDDRPYWPRYETIDVSIHVVWHYEQYRVSSEKAKDTSYMLWVLGLIATPPAPS